MSQTKAQLIDPVDGTIVNADINASAAIAASKIADFVTGNVNNRVLTASGTANSLVGESGLLFTSDSNDHALTLTGSGQAHLQLTSTSGSDHCSIDFGDSDDNDIGEIRYTNSTNSMHFDTNATLRMTLDSSGRLLLGTSTEGHENADDFTVAGSANSGITIRSGTTSFGQIFFSDGTSGDDEFRGIVGYSHTDNFMKFHTNAVERLRIDSNGDVLIGRSDTTGIPASGNDLVVSRSGNMGVTIQSTDSSYSNLYYVDSAGGNPSGYVSYQHSIDSLQFATATSEAMRLNSDGDLLINRTTTIDTSEVLGIKGPSGDHCTLGLTTDGTTNLGIIAFNDNDANFRGQIRYQHSTDSMQFYTNGANERLRILNTGGLTFNGDTATANALDDYEEGTFTPTAVPVTLTGTIAGHYTKIGDLCYVSAIFQIPSTSNTSDIEINGLPFNAKNGTDGNFIQGGYTIYHNQGSSYNVLLQNNMNRLVLYKLDGQRQTFDAFSGKTLRMAAVYKVA